MITSIKKFRKILENAEVSNNIEALVLKAQEYIANVQKSEEYQELKKQQDSELRELLSRVDMASVEANNVLVKVIKPHTRYRLNTTEYFQFVENSTDVITKEFAEIVAKLKETHTNVTPGKEYLRQTKNTKNRPTGDIATENFGDKVTGFFKSVFATVKGLLDKFTNDLDAISAKADSFMNVTEGYEEDRQAILDNPDLTPDERKKLLGNLSSKNSHAKRREGLKTTKEILEIAKSTIETTKQAQFYQDLAKSTEQELIEMLKAFGAKSIAIGDVILALGKANDVQTFDDESFTNEITNAQIVGDSVAKMAKALELIHQKEFKAKGEVIHEPIRENFLSTIGNKLKKFFSYFNFASRKADKALAELEMWTKALDNLHTPENLEQENA